MLFGRLVSLFLTPSVLNEIVGLNTVVDLKIKYKNISVNLRRLTVMEREGTKETRWREMREIEKSKRKIG